MRALFEKDLRLIFIRKSSIFIFLLVGIMFTWSFSGAISGAYITALGTILALSTISYDDFDNCLTFIFTLPCTKKQYVLEKYLFVYGFSAVAGIIGLVIIIASNLIKGITVDGMVIVEVLASELPILVVTGGLMIPLQIKFGPEKSRIVLMVIIGIVFVIGFGVQKLMDVEGILDSIDSKIGNMSTIKMFMGMVVVLVVLSVISFFITTKIMENKEIS